MKPTNKKRIEYLEKTSTPKRIRPKYAMVIHDPSIHNLDPDLLEIDADVVLILPDNGRRCKNKEYLLEGAYKITYSH